MTFNVAKFVKEKTKLPHSTCHVYNRIVGGIITNVGEFCMHNPK